MKAISYEDFKKVWKDSSREEILKQYYEDYTFLIELKNYRIIIRTITDDTYKLPNNKTKRLIDEITNKINGGEK